MRYRGQSVQYYMTDLILDVLNNEKKLTIWVFSMEDWYCISDIVLRKIDM
jgi:hypothetical protein